MKLSKGDRMVTGSGTIERKDRPIVGVGAVVFKGDTVLLVRRGRAPRLGEWSIPGGKQERGETVAEAVCREVREETGLEIRLVGLIDVIDAIDRGGDGNVHHHYTLIDFAAAWVSGEAVAADDVDEVAWVHPDRLGPYRLRAETIRVIDAARHLIQAANR